MLFEFPCRCCNAKTAVFIYYSRDQLLRHWQIALLQGCLSAFHETLDWQQWTSTDSEQPLQLVSTVGKTRTVSGDEVRLARSGACLEDPGNNDCPCKSEDIDSGVCALSVYDFWFLCYIREPINRNAGWQWVRFLQSGHSCSGITLKKIACVDTLKKNKIQLIILGSVNHRHNAFNNDCKEDTINSGICALSWNYRLECEKYTKCSLKQLACRYLVALCCICLPHCGSDKAHPFNPLPKTKKHQNIPKLLHWKIEKVPLQHPCWDSLVHFESWDLFPNLLRSKHQFSRTVHGLQRRRGYSHQCRRISNRLFALRECGWRKWWQQCVPIRRFHGIRIQEFKWFLDLQRISSLQRQLERWQCGIRVLFSGGCQWRSLQGHCPVQSEHRRWKQLYWWHLLWWISGMWWCALHRGQLHVLSRWGCLSTGYILVGQKPVLQLHEPCLREGRKWWWWWFEGW